MLKKQYLKTKPVCKVTFTLPVDALSEAKEVRVVGDFNNWQWESGTVMEKGKKVFKATLELLQGRHYQFRYIADNGDWENDWAADAYVPSPYFGIDNSVVVVEDQGKRKGNGAPVAKKPARQVAKQDDLKKIEGIGPKIAGLLADAGLPTFQDLADAPLEKLQQVLAQAGPRYRMHDPSTWSEQARLAAAGEKEALAELQQTLKGGKKGKK